jgi:hypothetical protein
VILAIGVFRDQHTIFISLVAPRKKWTQGVADPDFHGNVNATQSKLVPLGKLYRDFLFTSHESGKLT